MSLLREYRSFLRALPCSFRHGLFSGIYDSFGRASDIGLF